MSAGSCIASNFNHLQKYDEPSHSENASFVDTIFILYSYSTPFRMSVPIHSEGVHDRCQRRNPDGEDEKPFIVPPSLESVSNL
ncbi:hypothetical protein BDZ89DRAFT_1063179 [Hymenopellis radicata]|nr:hypothetical protein BDZ89DRAFT_1063179 [Hymenopellis radicata]